MLPQSQLPGEQTKVEMGGEQRICLGSWPFQACFWCYFTGWEWGGSIYTDSVL